MKRLAFGLLISSCILVLGACNESVGVADKDLAEKSIQQLIDPEIQGNDRQIMIEHYLSIPEEYWTDTVYLKDGKVYSNRVSLLGSMEPVKKVADGLGKLSNGEVFALPSQEKSNDLSAQTTTCTGSSGPFRRVKTPPRSL